jgi:hypothetical protein
MRTVWFSLATDDVLKLGDDEYLKRVMTGAILYLQVCSQKGLSHARRGAASF